jgi:hypothetical protein
VISWPCNYASIRWVIDLNDLKPKGKAASTAALFQVNENKNARLRSQASVAPMAATRVNEM